jgi:hypothetical protein
LARTDDDGKTWHETHAPDDVETVRFVSSSQGWAYGDDAAYRTRDGGRSWHRVDLNGRVRYLVIAGGYVYAVTECALPYQGCIAASELWQARLASDTGWHRVAMPEGVPSADHVEAQGHWLHLSAYDDDRGIAVDYRSSDHGGHFERAGDSTGCLFAPRLDATADGALWRFCRGGMFTNGAVSTDDGATFEKPSVGEIDGAVAAVDVDTVLAVRADLTLIEAAGGEPDVVLRTVDDIGFIDMTDTRAGFVITQSDNGRGLLWRTHDGGRRWTQVDVG